MKSVLLIGLGRFGSQIARELNERNIEVMAVDSNEARVNAVLPYVTNAQIGDSTNEEFLNTLGIRNFDSCVVAIGDSFQNSLETASLLKDLGAKRVIARASTNIQEKFLLKNGADEVVFPQKMLASWIATRCSSESILDYVEIGDEYSVLEIEIPSGWVGKTVLKLDVRKKHGINILGVRKNGVLSMNIYPELEFGGNDSVLVLGDRKAIHKCFGI